jgi:hypothetical protein
VVYRFGGILFSHREEENTSTCDNIDEPGGLYAKWNNPVIERQMWHFSSFIYYQ